MAASVAAILLLFLSRVQHSVQVPGSLAQPSNLEIAKFSPEHVLLGWNFTAPEGVTRETVIFRVEFSTPGGLSKKIDVNGRDGLRCDLTNLEENREYTAQITATTEGYQSSEAASVTFTTLEEDYPAPQLVNNILVSSRNLPKYELRWKLGRNDDLSGFEVEHCMRSCKTAVVHRSDRRDETYLFEYEVEAFHEPYNITITAIFAQPLDVRILRSLVHEAVSEVGEPSIVTNLHKVSQVGPVVHMKWNKPTMPNGPLSYYRLFIDEVIDGFSEMELRTTVNEINATLPVPASNFYRVRITAVNLDRRAGAIRSRTAYALIPYEPPESPSKIEIVNLRSDSVSFKVIPAAEFPGISFRIRVPSKGLFFSSRGSVNLTSLQPHETVFFSAATCYNENQEEEERCGPPLFASVTSNVEGPGEVNGVKITISEDETANLTWSQPRNLNGPLDGYVVSILAAGDSDAAISNTTLPRTELAFPLETDKCHEPCRIRVAAFNLDLITQYILVGASSEVLYRPHTRTPARIAGSILMLFVVGAIGGGFIYRRKCVQKKHVCPPKSENGNPEEITTMTGSTQ